MAKGSSRPEPITLDPDLAPWERQPNEDNNWFARFNAFREIGSQRSLLGLYNSQSKKKRLGVPQVWTERCRVWRWRERAEAWDEYLREEKFKADKEAREEAQAVRRLSTQMLQRMLDDMISRMQKAKFDERSLKELAQAAAVIMKESRLEFGEPTERPDITTQGGQIGAMPTDAEKMALIEWLRQQKAGIDDAADEW